MDSEREIQCLRKFCELSELVESGFSSQIDRIGRETDRGLVRVAIRRVPFQPSTEPHATRNSVRPQDSIQLELKARSRSSCRPCQFHYARATPKHSLENRRGKGLRRFACLPFKDPFHATRGH